MDRFWKYKIDHIIFWVATVLFHAFTRISLIESASVWQFALEIVVRNILLAVAIYTNLNILIPRFPQKKKYLLYLVLVTGDLFLYAFIKNIHDVYLYGIVGGDERYLHFFYNTFYNLSIALFYVLFSVGMQLSKEWYFQKEHIRKIEVEKLNTELDYLKAQINPHFLFNSINALYFLIEKQNSAARETLMTFSDMLRYQLYECNGHSIPIEKEVSYLKNYARLQQIRKDDNYVIDFASDSSVAGFSIAPLLLIPFVENAFKHVSHHAQAVNEVRIHLSSTGTKFKMEVVNTHESAGGTTGGIGLKNVRRRLELLYPGRHTLLVERSELVFKASIELEIV